MLSGCGLGRSWPRQPTEWVSIPSLPNPVVLRPASTPTSRRKLSLRSRFLIGERPDGPAVGWSSEIKRRATDPEARPLAIFDVFDGWFHKKSFEGCSSINVLLEFKAKSPVRRAASIHLAKIRAIVRGLVEEAKLREPERFAQAWQMLMKGSIVSVGEGNRNAARDAKCAAQLILDGWEREGKVSKPTTKRRFHR